MQELGGINLYSIISNDVIDNFDVLGLSGASSWIGNIVRRLSPYLSASVIQRVYSWLLARWVDYFYVKVTITYDVSCPTGADRTLLSESKTYVEEIQGIWANWIAADLDIFAFLTYKPKEHTVVRRYGCCKDCFGFNTRGWNHTKVETFTDEVVEELDLGIIVIGTGVKEHRIDEFEWRDCKTSVAPIDSWRVISTHQ